LTALLAPLIALLVLAAAAAALAVQRAWQRRLLGTSLVGRTTEAGPAVPDILYFTGKSCTICHVAQRPALTRLRELIDDVAVRELDVAEEREAARRYRVMTLPTTVVLDSQGRMTAVNAGFAGELLLRDQVAAARAASPRTAVA
jgi:thioredoxin 1